MWPTPGEEAYFQFQVVRARRTKRPRDMTRQELLDEAMAIRYWQRCARLINQAIEDGARVTHDGDPVRVARYERKYNALKVMFHGDIPARLIEAPNAEILVTIDEK